jgi:hypothetical protein
MRGEVFNPAPRPTANTNNDARKRGADYYNTGTRSDNSRRKDDYHEREQQDHSYPRR